MPHIAKGQIRSPASAWSLILLLGLLCVAALFIGLAVPVLPFKLSLVGFGVFLIGVAAFVVALIPDRKAVPYGLIFGIFSFAVALRFLWPNFAYIPIPALPTKNPQRLVWTLTIAYWLYSLATNLELRERLWRRCTRPTLIWLVFALFAWRFLSSFFSAYPIVGVLRVGLEVFDYLPALLFVLTWMGDSGDILRLGRWLLVTTLLISGLALIELITKRNLFLTVIPNDPTNSDFLQAALQSKLRGGDYRVQASFNHPLLLAQYLAFVLPLALLTFRADPHIWARRLALGVLLLMPIVFWATHTRTALGVSAIVAAIALSMVTLDAIRRPDPSGRRNLAAGIVLMGVLAAGAAIVALVAFLAVGRTSEESTSSRARIQMLHRAVKAAETNPLFGEGPGVGGYDAANVNSQGFATLDSYWLLLLLESGIPALLIYLTAVGMGASRISRAFDAGLRGNAQIAAAWALSLIAFAMTSLVLGTPTNLPLIYLAFGALIVLDDRPRSTQPKGPQFQRAR